jgi:hypothetical protein
MGQVNLTCSDMAASTNELETAPMTDTPTGIDAPTGDEEAPNPLTSEERLRALTSDHHRKSRGKSAPVPADAQRRPGDTVDAVRERSNMDPGRDTPA